MTATSITLPAGTLLELALASVIPGMESQYFDEFSPRVWPIAKDHGAVPVACFNVIEAMAEAPTPTTGNFVKWSSLCAHNELACDSRFLAIKNRRDETLSYLSAGHFFAVDETTTATLDADMAYAIVIASNNVSLPDTVLSLRLSDTSPNMNCTHRTLKIAKWTQEALMLADIKRSDASIYKVRFNPTDVNFSRQGFPK